MVASHLRQFGLHIAQATVEAVGLHELVMGADLGYLPAIEHDESVGFAKGRKPMGDREGRAVLDQPFQGRLDLHFRFRVYRRGRFVKDQDARVSQHGPGDGNPLAFPARQRLPALADDGVVAIGEIQDEAVGICGSCRGNDRVGRSRWIGVRDVGPDGAVEKIRVLEHDADLLPK